MAGATASMQAESGSAYLRDILRQYGLQDLAAWARMESIKGYDDVVVLQHMREQPLFQSRFAAIFDREKAGLPAISPAEVVAYEKQATDMFAAAGLPPGFWDQPEDFRSLIGRNISMDQLQGRVEGGFKQMLQAPDEVKGAFRDFFGANGDIALATYFLDPERSAPMLETQLATAQIAGTGRRHGIFTGESVAEDLARAGVSQQTAEQQFGMLQDTKGLFDENVDEENNISVDKEGVEAAFGTDAESRTAVAKRQESRAASFAGGGGTTTAKEGATGLGRAGQG